MINSEFDENLLHGECHLFAVAMHRHTGLRLRAYLDEDEDLGTMVLVHAFVIDGEAGIDVRGRMSIEKFIEDFDVNDPWMSPSDEPLLLRLGEGKDTIDEDDPRYRNAERHALEMIETLGLSKVVPGL